MHCWWECKLMYPLWKTVWRLFQRLNIKLPYDPVISLPGILLEEYENPNSKGYMYLYVYCIIIYNNQIMGAPEWLSWASNLGSGRDLTVPEFEPRVGLCADSSEPGACFGFCVSLSLCPSPPPRLSLSLSKINKNIFKNLKTLWEAWGMSIALIVALASGLFVCF